TQPGHLSTLHPVSPHPARNTHRNSLPPRALPGFRGPVQSPAAQGVALHSVRCPRLHGRGRSGRFVSVYAPCEISHLPLVCICYASISVFLFWSLHVCSSSFLCC